MNSLPSQILNVVSNLFKTVSNFKVTIRRYSISFTVLIALTVLYCLPEKYFNSGLNDYSYCLHKQFLGFGCPGCGLTRATYYLLHLKPFLALTLNASVFFLMPTIFGEIFYQFTNNEWSKKFRYLLYFIFCLSLFVVYLIRIFTFKS